MESSYKILTKREVIDKVDLMCPLCTYTGWEHTINLGIEYPEYIKRTTLLRCERCGTLVGISHIMNSNNEILYY